MKIQKLWSELFDLGIEIEDGIKWLDAGAKQSDAFYNEQLVGCVGEYSYNPALGECELISVIPGDLNGDGELNILDVVVLVNIVLGGSEPVDAGDLNGDGVLNVLDVVMLVNIIVNG